MQEVGDYLILDRREQEGSRERWGAAFPPSQPVGGGLLPLLSGQKPLRYTEMGSRRFWALHPVRPDKVDGTRCCPYPSHTG